MKVVGICAKWRIWFVHRWNVRTVVNVYEDIMRNMITEQNLAGNVLVSFFIFHIQLLFVIDFTPISDFSDLKYTAFCHRLFRHCVSWNCKRILR